MPRFSLLPVCCCVKNPRTSRNQEKKLNDVPMVNGNHRLAIPKVMVNGRVAMGGQRRVSTAPEPVVIEMLDDFTTARTSRDHCSDFLSMKELIRVVRSEEGLRNTPRQDYQVHEKTHEAIGRSLKRPLEVGKRNHESQARYKPPVDPTAVDESPCSSSSLHPQPLDAERLARLERVRKEIFYRNDNITTRTSSTARISSGTRSVSVATISGENILILPRPSPPPPCSVGYLAILPQMLIAMISISFGWLASLVSFILRK